MKKFWENGGKVLFTVIIVGLLIGVVLLFYTLQGAREKGEFAVSRSALHNLNQLAKQYADTHQGNFSNLCEESALRERLEFIEKIPRTGIFNWEPYSVKCLAEQDRYAISMTSFINLMSEPTINSHLCISNVSDEFVYQGRHVVVAACDTN